MKIIKLLSASLVAGLVAACATPQPIATGSAGPAPADSGLVLTTGTATAVATGTATGAHDTPPQGDKLSAPYVLIFKQTGGIAGFHMETIVDSAAKKMTYGGPRNQAPQPADLTPAELDALTRVLEEAKFTTFHRVKGPIPADAFEYTITVKTAGQEFTALWQDGATPPESYETVRSAITRLRDVKFRGNVPPGSPDR